MSDIVPHIVSAVLHSHRILCRAGIAIICMTSTSDTLDDPFEIKSFRYHALREIFKIYNVNLTLSNRFDGTDFGLEDDCYLDICEVAFNELDDACMILNRLCKANSANPSIASRRMIEVVAFTLRIIPDEVPIHFRSLSTIIAKPLPHQLLDQVSIITEFADSIHKAKTLFAETLRRPDTRKGDWQSSGFRSRSHFIRQVLLPIAVTQFPGGAHFMRWLAQGWSEAESRRRNNARPFEDVNVIYDPARDLKLDFNNPIQAYRCSRPAPWTSQFRGVWTYAEVGSYCSSLVQKQEASVVGQALNTRQIQFDLCSSRNLVLPRCRLKGISPKISEARPDKLHESENGKSQCKSSIKVDEIGEQNAITAYGLQRNTKTVITKTSGLSQTPRYQNHLTCPHCSIRISLPKDMERHVKTKHGEDRNVYYCPVQNCKRSKGRKYPFDRLDNWRRHVQTVHKIERPKDSEADTDSTSPVQDSKV